MSVPKKIGFGFLILVILTSSFYVLLPDKVRFDVKPTLSEIRVWEDDRWVLGGKEYVYLFDGSTKMRASQRNLSDFVYNNVFLDRFGHLLS